VIVTDSSCNLPQAFVVKHNIVMIPLQVIINNKSYLDKVNLSEKEFLGELKNLKNKISTSQPNVQDVKSAFNKALRFSPVALGIFISSKLSGTFQSIEGAIKKYDYEDTHLFDSRNVTGGLGLIIKETANAINAGMELHDIEKLIKKSIKNTTTFLSVATLDYLIKGGRLKKSTGFIAKLFRMLPILKIDHHGKAGKAGVSFGKKLNRNKIVKLAIKDAKRFNSAEFIVSHVDAEKEAQAAVNKIKKSYPYNEIFIVETTPVLAAHAGPGTVAISVLGRN